MQKTKTTESAEQAEVKTAPVKKTTADQAADKPSIKKTPVRKTPALKETTVIIQSPMGGEITPEDILAKVGPVDRVYVRVDENKAYWVYGEITGSVNLW